jgi:transposase
MKLSIQERKKYVIMLHTKGYTIRQIAVELHMSTRDVNEILKQYKREEKELRERVVIEKEEEEKERLFSSKRSKALQLYKKGTNLVDVAIELDISAEETKAFYHEYCSLQYPNQFLQIYMELNKTNSFNHFTDLFYLIREKGLNIEEGIEAIGKVNDFFLLKKEHQDLSNNITNLEKTQDLLKADNDSVKCQNDEMEGILYSKQEKIDIKEKALDIITKKLRQQQEELHKINSGEAYFTARKKIKLLVEEFLTNKRKVISISVTSIITALREDPDKQSIIDSILNSSDINQLDPEVTVFLEEKLRGYAEKIYYGFSETCIDSVLHP